MEYVIDFFATNYILVIIFCVIIIMFLIGYYAEKTNFGEVKYKDRNKSKDIEEEFVEQEIPLEQNIVESEIPSEQNIIGQEIPLKENVAEPEISLKENIVDVQTPPVENVSIETQKEEVVKANDIDSDDLETAFEKAFQEQISLADSEYLDEDIDNMKVDPLFSVANEISAGIDSNIKLPEIKKLDLKDEIIWDKK